MVNEELTSFAFLLVESHGSVKMVMSWKKNYNFYTSKDMKYTCIIIRYNLRVRNFLTKGLGTRTYFTLQRERKSETIMLLSTCAELLALFLKKINNLFLQCKKLLPGLGAKSTTGRTAEMKWYIYVLSEAFLLVTFIFTDQILVCWTIIISFHIV